jgi:hypothetical protein
MLIIICLFWLSLPSRLTLEGQTKTPDLANLSFSLALERVPNLTIRILPYQVATEQNTVTFYNCVSHDAINVFDKVCFYMIWQTFLSRLRSKGCQIVGSTPVHSFSLVIKTSFSRSVR